MIEVFVFQVTQTSQIFVKKDVNVTVKVKAEQGVFIGPEDVTIETGFPVGDSYQTFNLQANDFLYVVGSYPDTHMRVMVYSNTPIV